MKSLKSIYEKVFGSHAEKVIREAQPIVEHINALESGMQALSNDALKHKTVEFKERLAKGETLDDILPEAFAAVREAARRHANLRHYDVQMIGGIALHRGMISEMRTGEGKTLVATLPVYLNALEGKGVHVVTVNDYLAERDAVWMGQIYDALGMSVGIIQNLRVSYVYDTSVKATQEGGIDDRERDESGSYKVEHEFLRPCSRQDAYRCDITYGTNNEYGFDYLRDNMVQDISEMVMRPGSAMHYAVVDEIDSILIDEARTPLIISAPADEAADQYYQFAQLVKNLKENEDYNLDEKLRSATLTEAGIAKFEKSLGVENIYAEGGMRIVHHIEQALKAEVLFKRDKEYVVEKDEVIIIDEFTGRKMPGRRYSEGLHQAIEAKEGVAIQRESRTLATITFQNFFRMYKKLSGMTGTAATEEDEFRNIYGLDVLVIPTNRQDQRHDHPDRIYKTEYTKFKAVVKKIQEARAKGQPILVGTISVEKNEVLSQFLTAQAIPHETLNAKNHEREGEIIALAGMKGAVTLATNMAGRGVDIKLGGPHASDQERKQILDAGGLFVLGTERHESRRIDNQLRGRSARQGDVGETQFFVSTDDDLLRIFAGDRLKSVMERLKVPDDMPIEQGMVSRMLENAQKKVEAHHYDIRKHLLEYDDILNKQRHVIYRKRREILELGDKAQETVQASVVETIQNEENTFVVQEEPFGSSRDESAGESVNQIHNENVAQDRIAQGKEKIYISLKDMILDMVEREIEFIVSAHTTAPVDVTQEFSETGEPTTSWNIKEIYETAKTIFSFNDQEKNTLLAIVPTGDGKLDEVTAREQVVQFLMKKAQDEYAGIEARVMKTQEEQGMGSTRMLMNGIERGILLRSIDNLWVDHLVGIDYLRTGIGLQGYAQRDPLVEYKREAYQMFLRLQENIQKEVVYAFYKVGIGIQLAPSIMDGGIVLQGAQKTMGKQQPQTEGIEGKVKMSKKERRRMKREGKL